MKPHSSSLAVSAVTPGQSHAAGKKVGGLRFDLILKACRVHNMRLTPAHDIILLSSKGGTNKEVQRMRSPVKMLSP